jgi:hypothetical protein
MSTTPAGTGATALAPTRHLLRRTARRAARRFCEQAPGNAATVNRLQRGPYRYRVDYVRVRR